MTQLKIYKLSGRGRTPNIEEVDDVKNLTTRDIPRVLVKNIISLHETALPDVARGFAKNIHHIGLMDQVLQTASFSEAEHVDMESMNPEELYEVFYKESFLRNEDASKCLIYTQDGKIMGMAQVGKFGRDYKEISCTISNFILSPKLDPTTQAAITRHVASEAVSSCGEASLLASSSCASAYQTHGFNLTDSPTSPTSSPGGRRDKIVRYTWAGK